MITKVKSVFAVASVAGVMLVVSLIAGDAQALQVQQVKYKSCSNSKDRVSCVANYGCGWSIDTNDRFDPASDWAGLFGGLLWPQVNLDALVNPPNDKKPGSCTWYDGPVTPKLGYPKDNDTIYTNSGVQLVWFKDQADATSAQQELDKFVNKYKTREECYEDLSKGGFNFSGFMMGDISKAINGVKTSFYEWYIKDTNSGQVVWQRKFRTPADGEDDTTDCVDKRTNVWVCNKATIPDGILEFGKTYEWSVHSTDLLALAGYAAPSTFAASYRFTVSVPVKQGCEAILNHDACLASPTCGWNVTAAPKDHKVAKKANGKIVKKSQPSGVCVEVGADARPVVFAPVQNNSVTTTEPVLRWLKNQAEVNQGKIPSFIPSDFNDAKGVVSYRLYIKDADSGIVVWARDFVSPEGGIEGNDLLSGFCKDSKNQWFCNSIKVPAGKLQMGKTYTWAVAYHKTKFDLAGLGGIMGFNWNLGDLGGLFGGAGLAVCDKLPPRNDGAQEVGYGAEGTFTVGQPKQGQKMVKKKNNNAQKAETIDLELTNLAVVLGKNGVDATVSFGIKNNGTAEIPGDGFLTTVYLMHANGSQSGFIMSPHVGKLASQGMFNEAVAFGEGGIQHERYDDLTEVRVEVKVKNVAKDFNQEQYSFVDSDESNNTKKWSPLIDIDISKLLVAQENDGSGVIQYVLTNKGTTPTGNFTVQATVVYQDGSTTTLSWNTISLDGGKSASFSRSANTDFVNLANLSLEADSEHVVADVDRTNNSRDWFAPQAIKQQAKGNQMVAKGKFKDLLDFNNNQPDVHNKKAPEQPAQDNYQEEQKAESEAEPGKPQPDLAIVEGSLKAVAGISGKKKGTLVSFEIKNQGAAPSQPTVAAVWVRSAGQETPVTVKIPMKALTVGKKAGKVAIKKVIFVPYAQAALVGVEIDPEGKLDESSTENNSATIALTRDLTIDGEISVTGLNDQDANDNNDKVVVVYVIKNTGNAPTAAFSASTTVTTKDEIISKATALPALLPGATAKVKSTFNATKDTVIKVAVWVDSKEQVSELDEDNNYGQITLQAEEETESPDNQPQPPSDEPAPRVEANVNLDIRTRQPVRREEPAVSPVVREPLPEAAAPAGSPVPRRLPAVEPTPESNPAAVSSPSGSDAGTTAGSGSASENTSGTAAAPVGADYNYIR